MTSVTTPNTFANYYMNVDNGTMLTRAVARYNEAMDTTKTTSSKYVDCWTDPHGVIMVHLKNGGVAAVHGVKSVGGNFETPIARILGHVGTNTRAIAGVVDHEVGASMVTLTIPNKAKRDNCTSIQEMKDIVAALREDTAGDDDTSVASNTRSNKGGKAEDTEPEDDDTSTTGKKKKKKKKGSKAFEPDKHVMFAVFKPAPFLQKLIIESGASNPEEILVYVREKMDDFEYPTDSTERDYRDHVDSLEVWCYGVMGNQVPKVGIRINPFDGEICKYSDEYHRICLGNEVAGPASRGSSIISGPNDATNAALDLLAKSVFRLKEDNESTADVLDRQLTFQKEIERKKKDKTENGTHPRRR